jgi:hypothetical protein
MIRSLHVDDLPELKRIHEAHFKDEFIFPDFLRYLCAFVVEDEEGIITAGGVRTIAECALITDLSRDPRRRLTALYQMLDASIFVCKRTGFDQIYAWSQNPRYTRRLKKNGFREPQGQSLILDL